jgi:hypothetical protein
MFAAVTTVRAWLLHGNCLKPAARTGGYVYVRTAKSGPTSLSPPFHRQYRLTDESHLARQAAVLRNLPKTPAGFQHRYWRWRPSPLSNAEAPRLRIAGVCRLDCRFTSIATGTI